MVGVALVTFVSIFAAGREGDDRRGGRRQPQGRVRRPEHRRLLAVLAGACCRRVEQVAGRQAVERRCASRQASVPGVKRQRRPSSGIDPATFERPLQGHVERRRRRAARARPGGATLVAASARRRPQAQGRATPSRSRRRPRKTRDAARRPAIVNDKGGLIADAHRHEPADARRDFGEPQGRVRARRRRGRARTQSRSRSGSSSACSTAQFPEAEAQTAKEFIDDAGRPGQPAARADLRAARAGRDRLAVRDRQHARAVDQRAHARARACCARSARRAPGPADRPLRGGDHGADRRGRSASCSGVVLAVLFTQPLDGFTLSIPVGLADPPARARRRSPAWWRRSSPARRAARLDVLDALAYE